jgi:hypothetical protein
VIPLDAKTVSIVCTGCISLINFVN